MKPAFGLELEDIKRGDGELQRQIDEIRRLQGDTFSLKDAFQETRQEVRELKEMMLRGRGQSSPAP